MFCFTRKAERQQLESMPPPAISVSAAPTAAEDVVSSEDVISDISSDGKYEVDIPTPKEFSLANVHNIRFIDSDRQDSESVDEGQEERVNEDDESYADLNEVFLSGDTRIPPLPPDPRSALPNKYLPIDSVSSSTPSETLNGLNIAASTDALNGRTSSASTADIGRLFSSSASHQGSLESTLDNINLIDGSPTRGRSPAPGPRFKVLHEGDIQICRLNHTRTVISKLLSSKFLRRWETHHLYLNDRCISSKTPVGFLESPFMYSAMHEIYAVIRWDTSQKFCLRIVLNDGSLLMQANNAYTRDQWYHSILWKRNLYRYRNTFYSNTLNEDALLKELKNFVDFVLTTPLQDETITSGPLEIISKLFTEENLWSDGGEAALIITGPLISAAALPESLANALSTICQTRSMSFQVKSILHHIARHILKHNVDFGKAPHHRRFLQDFVSAIYRSPDGAETVCSWVGTVHGPGFNCPHPRVLPNLAATCLAALHSLPSTTNQEEELLTISPINDKYDNDFIDFDDDACNNKNNNVISNSNSGNINEQYHNNINLKHLSKNKSEDTDENIVSPTEENDIICFTKVISYMSSYADWIEGLGAVLQPVPIPSHMLQSGKGANALAAAVVRIGTDSRCVVHRHILPLRHGRPGWFQIICPTHSNPDPDRLQQWGEILDTLLNCCCKRKWFLVELANMLPACLLLALRAHPAGLESLCLMLEWEVLECEQSRVEAVQALRSTPPGRRALHASCQRQVNLKKLQQKGGPRRLTLPSCATDADVARLLSAGSFGNLECLSLAFTHVTSAVAEQLIKLPSLRYLNLWATQFGDTGVLLIVEHLHRLQVLNLCETPVSDVGIAALSALTGLRKLNLNSTKLSAAMWARLQPMLPALQECDVRYTDAW